MKVILAEKPKQARSYAEAFKNVVTKKGYLEVWNEPNDKYLITWAIGHLLEIPTPDYYGEQYKKWSLDNLPFFPEITFQVKESTKEQYDIVYKLFSKADTIIVGSDPDREGENIAWSIVKTIPQYQQKTIKRLWINSLEPEVVAEGLKNLKDAADFYNSYLEAQSRQISDYLIGMNYSPLYTLLLEKKGIQGTFSIGRVQTPTLYLIYEREQQIKNFKEEKFYTPKLEIEKDNIKTHLTTSKKFKSKAELEEFFNFYINRVFENTFDDIIVIEGKDYAPKLHSLSTLQTYLNKEYKLSAAATLSCVQSLYEKKILTYPRTACNYITTSEYEYLKNHFNEYEQFLNINTSVDISTHEPSNKYVANDKVLEHHAIIPTKKVPSAKEFEALSREEKIVYEEVVLNTVLTFMKPHIYNKTTLKMTILDTEFSVSGKEVISNSWKAFRKSSEDTVLPSFDMKEKVSVTLLSHEGKTKKPSKISEGNLITMMKNVDKKLSDEDLDSDEELSSNYQLGTEATRADIIETLKKREYIEINNGKINITRKGEILCKAVTGTLLASPQMTAAWENFLEKIATGQGKPSHFIANVKAFIEKLIKEAPDMIDHQITPEDIEQTKHDDAIGRCPLCEEGFIKHNSKFKYYGCSNKECKQTFSSNFLSKSISEAQFKKLLDKGKTDVIKGFVGKSDKKFDAFLTIEKQDLDKYGTKFVYKLNFKK